MPFKNSWLKKIHIDKVEYSNNICEPTGLENVDDQCPHNDTQLSQLSCLTFTGNESLKGKFVKDIIHVMKRK